MLDSLKIAIVCDWLTVFAGGERVIYEMHQLFPRAPIYTTLYNKKKCPEFAQADVRQSWLRFIPGAKWAHRLFLPFMPLVFERLDLSEYDLVLSSSHSAAKGILTQPGTLHVTYCHSPMRYVWDHSHSYQNQFRSFLPLQILYKPLLHRIRLWDRLAAERVDRYLTNSKYVAARIQKYYHRESELIAPPVDLSFFVPDAEAQRMRTTKKMAYLAVGRLIPYKRFDLAVKACKKLKRPLHIVGEGPELGRLKKLAGKDVVFLGKISDEDLRKEYQKAKALVFPQLEDFGIVPLEAMACGTPVIAYGKGGALETVKENISGLFFDEQTEDSLVKAIQKFEKKKWDEEKISDSVSEFSSARFRSALRHFLENAWKEHREVLG
ncbi:hypothetical protein A2974_01495 [Candidatus Peregrinibacteria bacterium RIFCSPLOWO2_01_FULL_48_20]|nr:MAG: hypothetical protein A2974_01495 [Candidatus Peregrinibacteria bacterium RIFCSPLOWO2_01_FULL_48_20]